MAESEEELKSLLMKVKEESEKVGFFLRGSKITADGDCSHEIKRHLLLRREAMTKHVKKQRHYLANKGPSSQNFIFSHSHVWI